MEDWTGTAYQIAVGTGAGAVTGGPLGAAVAGSAAALTTAIEYVRRDSFGGKALARLQEDRLEETIREADRVIGAMWMGGHQARTDWFRVEDGDVKASVSGVELLEGTLIAAANEFERRKVKLMANLWAQLAFNPSVAFDAGVFLLKTASELSYRHLALLATITELSGSPPTAEEAGVDVNIAQGPVLTPKGDSDADEPFQGSSTLGAQVFDLVRRDIVRQDDGNSVPFNSRQIRPFKCAPTHTGRRLYVLTGMRTHIELAEKEALAVGFQDREDK